MADRYLRSHAGQEGYGSEADNREYLRRNGAKRNRLLNQFKKLESGLGNSKASVEGYERVDWSVK
jgi:hypothetical protein